MLKPLSDSQVNALPARTRIDALVAERKVLVRWIGTALSVFVFCVITTLLSSRGNMTELIGLGAFLAGFVLLYGLLDEHVRRALFGGFVIRARLQSGEYVWVSHTDDRFEAYFGHRSYTGLIWRPRGFVLYGHWARRWELLECEFGGAPGELTAYVLTDFLSRTVRVRPDPDAVIELARHCRDATHVGSRITLVK